MGYFSVTTKAVSDDIISFVASSFSLNFRAESLVAMYLYEGDFDFSRSPDPIYEEEEFLGKLR